MKFRRLFRTDFLCYRFSYFTLSTLFLYFNQINIFYHGEYKEEKSGNDQTDEKRCVYSRGILPVGSFKAVKTLEIDNDTSQWIPTKPSY
jgi:hypothetical protein